MISYQRASFYTKQSTHLHREHDVLACAQTRFVGLDADRDVSFLLQLEALVPVGQPSSQLGSFVRLPFLGRSWGLRFIFKDIA